MIFNPISYPDKSGYDASYWFYYRNTLGATVKWNNTEWIVVNIAGSIYTLALKEVTEETTFGTNGTYKGSTIENKCIEYENSAKSDSLKLAINTTVLNTTHKIYIPESTCFAAKAVTGERATIYHSEAGTYQWYNSTEHKICVSHIEQSNRLYWTASLRYTDTNNNDNAYMYIVHNDGNVAHDYAGRVLGFRPHVRVQL